MGSLVPNWPVDATPPFGENFDKADVCVYETHEIQQQNENGQGFWRGFLILPKSAHCNQNNSRPDI